MLNGEKEPIDLGVGLDRRKTMRMPSKIAVEVEKDRMGNIIARPVNARYAKAFAKARRDNGGGGGEDAFFNDGNEAEQFKSNYLNSRQRKDLERGYPVRLKMDPWDVGHLYGYDAHTVVESGESVLRQRRYLGEGKKRIKPTGIDGLCYSHAGGQFSLFQCSSKGGGGPLFGKTWTVGDKEGALKAVVKLLKKKEYRIDWTKKEIHITHGFYSKIINDLDNVFYTKVPYYGMGMPGKVKYNF